MKKFVIQSARKLRERERGSQKNMAQATNIAQHHHRTAKQQEQHLAISSAHCTHIWIELLPVWLRTHRTIRKLDYYQCPPSAKYKVFFHCHFIYRMYIEDQVKYCSPVITSEATCLFVINKYHLSTFHIKTHSFL